MGKPYHYERLEDEDAVLHLDKGFVRKSRIARLCVRTPSILLSLLLNLIFASLMLYQNIDRFLPNHLRTLSNGPGTSPYSQSAFSFCQLPTRKKSNNV